MRKALGGALMVCGTTSDAGKTTIVAGLCRVLQRQGISVAPFKAQNMALNSAVTISGHEIGRAQYLQAQAARVEPEVTMNPVLLKPTGERSSQVVVMGKAIGEMSAVQYHSYKPELFELVTAALADLRSRFDVVLVEGAGSPAEINLLPHDIVNLRLAKRAGMQAILVGNIDPGGVFASLFGTIGILPNDLSDLIAAFVINKFRGDPALLLDGTAQLEAACGVPTIGIVPMLQRLHLDAEDSLALDHPSLYQPDGTTSSHDRPATVLDTAIIRFPHISNFTDLDPLLAEEGVSVRFVQSARELGHPDLVVLPGTKATVQDLIWLKAQGLDIAIKDLIHAQSPPTVIGICGGYQMLGHSITDGVEDQTVHTIGLGLLPVDTKFDTKKTLTRTSGKALGQQVEGYQIHHGRVLPQAAALSWLELGLNPEVGDAPTPEGIVNDSVCGTTLHGLFESDQFRREFLRKVASDRGLTFEPSDFSASQLRDSELDRLADHLESNLDIDFILNLAAKAQKTQ